MDDEKFRFTTEIETQTGNVKSVFETVSLREPDSDPFHNQKYKLIIMAGEKFRFTTEIETRAGNVKSVVDTVSLREPHSDLFAAHFPFLWAKTYIFGYIRETFVGKNYFWL